MVVLTVEEIKALYWAIQHLDHLIERDKAQLSYNKRNDGAPHEHLLTVNHRLTQQIESYTRYREIFRGMVTSQETRGATEDE
jgi:hypothetical protein